MGKKTKVGKQRRDKYYHLAKETGYRSRSAFKLLQLNRKFEFLQNSRVLIDLCAAPGGWLQVATKAMPVSSVVVGVDLHPIKPIPRVTTLVSDITTEKCRQGLRKELHHWKADCVLHDGAPNVGANWLLDSHNQARLTLQAGKLACEFLKKGGWFITKVFRSRDYQTLIWVFHQLFRKVHATKPQASRRESAEIFVVCQGFIAPDKIDPKFFDPKYIFKELPVDEAQKKLLIFQDPTKAKKAKADGYTEGETSLYHKVNMSDFINSDEPVNVLNGSSELIFDVDEIKSHRLTTDEIRECSKDIKVLGRREIRMLLTWQKSMRSVLENAEKWQKEKTGETASAKRDEVDEDEDNDSIDDEELQKKLDEMKEEDRIVARRLQKTATKKKRKIREKLQKLGLMQSAVGEDEGIDQESSLFKLQQIKNKEQLSEVDIGDLSFLDKEEEEEIVVNTRQFIIEKRGKKITDPTHREDEDDEDESDDDLPSDLEDEEKELLREEMAKMKPKEDESDSDFDSGDEAPTNPLMMDLDDADITARAHRTTSMWFSKEVFDGLEDDEDEDLEITQMSEHYQKMGGSIKEKPAKIEESDNDEEAVDTSKLTPSRKVSFNTTIFSMDDSGNKKEEDFAASDDDDDEFTTLGKNVNDVDSDSSDSDYDESVLGGVEKEPSMTEKPRKNTAAKKDGFEIVSSKAHVKARKLDPCGLAIGAQIATSRKRRREIIDHGYNRYVYGEEDGLPVWFTKDEKIHCRRIMPVTKAQIEEYKERLREINARPIKKVAQAKARKKLRHMRKLEKLKKKAESLGDTIDTSEKEKYSQIKNLYKKAGLDGQRKKNVTYVVAKKGLSGKRVNRPRGLKGPYKVVDTRMKADLRGKKANDARRKKGIKRRRLK